ncbi:FRG domain-containing protein [Neisseria mucosa]|uniref:FRG domain-containing protein n=1 Tax=Neisseria mucosa TaxID=488 RepID=UPI00280B9C3C|nr:FRG domain-containing protein [Neisseria mucosa]
MCSHEISSVSDLLEILKEIGEPEQGHTRFFRGQADVRWRMLPGIYREGCEYLIENEHKIIKDTFTNCPDDFSPDDTLFEKLVKLQHYGYATRLLDLTANVLVALYFAAWNKEHHDKDGELIILDIPDEEVKYGDSDTVAVLSAVSLQPKTFNISECLNNIESLVARKTFEEIIENHNIASWLEKQNVEQYKESYPEDIKNLIEAVFEDIRNIKGEELIKTAFNSQKEIAALTHDVRTDKPSFLPVIDPRDFERVLCVRAKLNNARISRQQGCFLLFGIDDSKLKPVSIPDGWQRKAKNNQQFIVKNKESIMEELRFLGISKKTLFPELESQAEEIMSQYKPKQHGENR